MFRTMKSFVWARHRALVAVLILIVAGAKSVHAGYEVCISNERSGDITVLDGDTRQVVATIPVGKSPRGIIASSDGKTVYVALSGTPISGPPKLDAHGNPILHKGGDD